MDEPTIAPAISPGAPTVSPIKGTRTPSTEAPTKVPTIGTAAPADSPSKASIVGTAPPSVVPPTKAPTIGTTRVNPPLATPPTDEGSEPLNPGPAIAIALVATFVVSAAGYVYYNRRKRNSDDPELQDVANKDLDDLEAGLELERRANARLDAELAGDDVMRPGGGGSGRNSDGGISACTDGAIRPTLSSRGDATTSDRDSRDSDAAVYDGEPYDSPDYIPGSSGPGSPRSSSSQDAVTGVAGVPGVPASPRRNEGTDSSSAASEGGWSSSAGVSSLNTGSFDAGTDDGLLPGSPDRLLAAIGVADTVAHTAGPRRDEK